MTPSLTLEYMVGGSELLGSDPPCTLRRSEDACDRGKGPRLVSGSSSRLGFCPRCTTWKIDLV